MFKSHFINGNQSNKTYFKKYSNELAKIKAMSKKLYHSTKLQESQSDPRGRLFAQHYLHTWIVLSIAIQL